MFFDKKRFRKMRNLKESQKYILATQIYMGRHKMTGGGRGENDDYMYSLFGCGALSSEKVKQPCSE